MIQWKGNRKNYASIYCAMKIDGKAIAEKILIDRL